MIRQSLLKLLGVVLFLSLFTSCGGGGGGSSPAPAPPPPNQSCSGAFGEIVNEGTMSAPKDLGTAPLTYAGGYLLCPGSKSYYQFTTSRAGSYIIKALSPTNNMKITLYAQKSDFNLSGIVSADNIFTNSLNDLVMTAKNLDGNTVYYIETMDYGASSATYTVSVQLADSEGSIKTPIVLTPDGSTHASGVDAWGYSYYKFTTTGGGYLIGLKGSSVATLSWTLYSDPAFQNQVPGDSCDGYYAAPGNATCGASNLPAGTYYLMVHNIDSTSALSYSISVTPDTIGAASTAVTLNPDTHATSTIADNELQYYSFTPVSSGTYTITLTPSQNMSWDLYSDVTCSTLVKTCLYDLGSTNVTKCTTPNLPRGTYYLRVTNNVTSTGSYDLIVSGNGGSEGAIGDPMVVTSRTPFAGHVAPGESSYYTFRTETLSNPSAYLITLTGLNVPPTAGWINWVLYSDLSFSTYIAYCSKNDYLGNIVCSTNEANSGTALLNPNTSYYLKVYNNNYATYLTYSVAVTPLSSDVGCTAGGTCFNFESNAMSQFVAYSNNPIWITASTTGTGGTGSYNAQSGIVGKNQAWSCFQTSLTDVKWVTFSLGTQFGTGTTDELRFYVDFVGSVLPAQSWTGTNAWQRVVIRPTSGGTHTYGWCHYKPDTTVTDNQAWVDDIEFNY